MRRRGRARQPRSPARCHHPLRPSGVVRGLRHAAAMAALAAGALCRLPQSVAAATAGASIRDARWRDRRLELSAADRRSGAPAQIRAARVPGGRPGGRDGRGRGLRLGSRLDHGGAASLAAPARTGLRPGGAAGGLGGQPGLPSPIARRWSGRGRRHRRRHDRRRRARPTWPGRSAAAPDRAPLCREPACCWWTTWRPPAPPWRRPAERSKRARRAPG